MAAAHGGSPVWAGIGRIVALRLLKRTFERQTPIAHIPGHRTDAAGRFRLAVDVFPEEPVPADAPMRRLQNVLFSSHRAGGIWDSYARIREMMLDDIGQILAGHPPLRLQRAEPHQAAAMRSR